MRPPWSSPIARLRYRYDPEPAEPDAIVGQRPRGSRRPHTDARVSTVRRLIEETTLTYGEIAARTGVGRASICRWTRDGGWKRPLFAPRATDTVPSARASAKLRRRTLAARLTALAERHIAELEAAACVDAQKLGEALELLKMAKLAGMARRRPRKGPGQDPLRADPMRPIGELCVADVDLSRAPRAAVEDFLANRAPPPVEETPRRRGGRRRTRFDREEYNAWMREKEK
jgi:predicted DNA-binding transcriptional regulator AlpA